MGGKKRAKPKKIIGGIFGVIAGMIGASIGLWLAAIMCFIYTAAWIGGLMIGIWAFVMLINGVALTWRIIVLCALMKHLKAEKARMGGMGMNQGVGMQPGVVMGQPGVVPMGQPGVVMGQPGMMQPGMMQPGMMQPGMMQPGMMGQQPGVVMGQMGQPMGGQPGVVAAPMSEMPPQPVTGDESAKFDG